MDPQESLFTASQASVHPLARRMRPSGMDSFRGQNHIREQIDRLFVLLDEGTLFSLIIHGPPGTGKSALAELIASCSGSRFITLNAVTSNTAEVKQAIGSAREALSFQQQRTVLFIDEIHRFNKLQQDALLPAVENGTVYLIGVTTQNPSFSVNPALRSRCHTLEFRALEPEDVGNIIDEALADEASGLGRFGYRLSPDARKLLVAFSGGDARRALNILEIAASPGKAEGEIGEEDIRSCVGGQNARYDRDGDEHYDVTSAFIKAMRGSDPDATVYYLARMLEGGEDPRFIARRIMICASEDVGLADSGVLPIAVAAADAVERVGMPEGALFLSHAALRVSLAAKSNSACLAINAARKEIRDQGTQPVPDYLKDSHYRAAAAMNRGTGYRYPHDFPGHWVKQAYLHEYREYYSPAMIGNEAGLVQRLQSLREASDGL